MGKDRYTNEEEELLARLVDQYPYNWEIIYREFVRAHPFPKRTRTTLYTK